MPKSQPEDENVTLEVWSLFLRSHAALIQRIEQELDQAGHVPLGWYDILLILQRAPAGKRRVSELVEKSVLTKSGMSRLLDRLEAAELISREPCPDDRRASFAILTDTGFAALKSAWPVYQKAIDTWFANTLSPEEIPVLASVFRRLLGQAKEGPTARPHKPQPAKPTPPSAKRTPSDA